MYTPSQFSISDKATIFNFIEEYGFGILISKDEDGFHDTHTPLFISDDLSCLYGHMARANPQWKGWKDSPLVKVIFHGPHAYISPSYYTGTFNVPTWNYTAVSVSGKIEVIESLEEKIELINSLVERHEKGFDEPWKLDTSDAQVMNLFGAIVCFRVKVEGIEAKFKLNQNKDEKDRLSVVKHLERSQSYGDTEIARLMKNL